MAVIILSEQVVIFIPFDVKEMDMRFSVLLTDIAIIPHFTTKHASPLSIIFVVLNSIGEIKAGRKGVVSLVPPAFDGRRGGVRRGVRWSVRWSVR